MTTQQMIESAMTDKYGICRYGRFKINVVPVGRPRFGQMSGVSSRIDCYVDGKRVKRSVFENERNK